MKELEKSVAAPFQVNVWRSPQESSLESSFSHWVKCTYRQLRSVFGLLQENSWCPKGGQEKHLFQQHDFPFNVYESMANTYSKEQALLMDTKRKDRGKRWIQIFDKTQDLSIRSFWCHSTWHQEEPLGYFF